MLHKIKRNPKTRWDTPLCFITLDSPSITSYRQIKICTIIGTFIISNYLFWHPCKLVPTTQWVSFWQLIFVSNHFLYTLFVDEQGKWFKIIFPFLCNAPRAIVHSDGIVGIQIVFVCSKIFFELLNKYCRRRRLSERDELILCHFQHFSQHFEHISFANLTSHREATS